MLLPLPTNLNFFFSSIFYRGVCSDDLATVKEHSFFQL